MDASPEGFETETVLPVKERTTKWYVNSSDDEQPEIAADDVIDYDFIQISVQHIIKNRKTISGTILLTPRNFIFDPRTADPLDELEPELFQVAFPTGRISNISIYYEYNSSSEGNVSNSILRNVTNVLPITIIENLK